MPDSRPTTGRRAMLAVAAAALAGCTAPTRQPGSTTPASPGPGTPAWETYVSGQYTLSAPAVVGDSLVLGSERSVRALSTDDGEARWETALGALTHAFTPAAAGGTLVAAARDAVGGTVLGEGNGSLAALALADGSVRWQVPAPVTSSPAVAGGAVYAGTAADGGELRSLSLADGSPRWRTPLGPADRDARVGARPAVAGDAVHAGVAWSAADGGRRGAAVALDPADGSPRWRAPVGPVTAPPVAADGTLYVGTADGAVLAVDRATGRERWRSAVGDPVHSAPAVDADRVYVAAGDGVRALDRATGRERWHVEVGSVDRTGVAVADGVYAGGNFLSALTPGGEVRWRRALEGAEGTFGTPVVRGDRVYTGACIKREASDPYDHHVYAYRR